MRILGDILREVVLLGLLGACAWWFPRTMLAIEAVCGVGTVFLFLFEQRVFKAG